MMKVRSYFLFADTRHAQDVVSDLESAGIRRSDIHAVAKRGVNLGSLPVAGKRQLKDVCCKLENLAWNGNLVVFGLALVGLVLSWWQGSAVGALVAASIMLLTFVAGERFTARVPSVHLREFQDALNHGEILIAVDTPKTQLGVIDRLVASRHPEAIRGGVSWTWPTLERA